MCVCLFERRPYGQRDTDQPNRPSTLSLRKCWMKQTILGFFPFHRLCWIFPVCDPSAHWNFVLSSDVFGSNLVGRYRCCACVCVCMRACVDGTISPLHIAGRFTVWFPSAWKSIYPPKTDSRCRCVCVVVVVVVVGFVTSLSFFRSSALCPPRAYSLHKLSRSLHPVLFVCRYAKIKHNCLTSYLFGKRITFSTPWEFLILIGQKRKTYTPVRHGRRGTGDHRWKPVLCLFI